MTEHTPSPQRVVVPVDDDTRPFSDSLLPEAMIYAGSDALDKAQMDMANYVSGETIDWDQGMMAVAVYRAMLAAAPAPEGVDARAVAKALHPALFSHDKVEAHRAASPMAVTVARTEAVEAVRKVLDAAALTPRHEAPASETATDRALRVAMEALDRYLPDSLPANDKGQIHFARALAEAAADAIRAHLAARQ